MTILAPKAPALPLPTSEYTPQYLNQLLNVLRLYFNQLDSTNRAEIEAFTQYHGSFSDTTTQTLGATNTATAITFDSTDVSDGVLIGSPTSRIVCNYTGVYNFQFSAQLKSGSASTKNAYFWPRIDGTDVPNSATRITISGSGSYVVPAWNFLLQIDAGSYFQLMWAADDTNVSLIAEASTAFCPAIPSIILTAVRETN